MSRPFSYSDENFTVIGNILFCHIRVTKAFESETNIVEIPTAIYDRMYHKSMRAQFSSSEDDMYTYRCSTFNIRKSLSDGKYYIVCDSYIEDTYIGYYIVAWYALKDI